MKSLATLFLVGTIFLWLGCDSEKTDVQGAAESTDQTFQDDVDFLKKYTHVLVLEEPSGKGKIAVSGALQGRVMTSSTNGSNGRSHGWINRGLFKSGDTLDHINPFGGEERFWLGPEGGQYSVFFEKDAQFNIDEWQTPRLIDLEAFDLEDSTATSAVYRKIASLTNYSGFTFELAIERVIKVLQVLDIFQSLKFTNDFAVRVVGYRTTNTLTNRGNTDWKKESGLLSIWLLGMYNPSDATTVVVPYVEGDESELGPIVNDNYFGKVPGDRLKIGKGVLYFRGDGKYRSKIGLLPSRAKNILGSYDAQSKTLTILKYSKPEGVTDYVNSLWQIQDQPYKGDVVNSYNDGPSGPGNKPLGPFYEMETSSPALALKAGQSFTHVQETYHFEGGEKELDGIARQLLGVSLEEIKSSFQ